jgi:ABC-type sugar transport system ATPase subunit/ribose/xylose/arabinose/galactoside ABC-type transport system permease subunit
MVSAQPLIQICNITKVYGGVTALKHVRFDILPGEIRAVCGENGAGKSTLNNILSGSCIPDTGTIHINGELLHLGSVPRAETAGIAIIHQESTAFLHLNAEENIFVGREPRHYGGLLLDKTAMRMQTRRLLDQLGEKFDQRKPLSELTFAQHQMVAIARALSRSCRLLIMDEPTASLSAREIEVLFQIIRQLRHNGVSVLYVSHRLEEIFELADRVTVLRDGRLIGTSYVHEIDKEQLVHMMVGREIDESTSRTSPPGAAGKVVLEVQNLTRKGSFHDVSFSIRAGEIVGLAGLVGAGRSEVAQAIFGIDAPDSGTVKVDEKLLPLGSTQAAIRYGVSLVPEDRQQLGLVLAMSVRANISLSVLRSLTRGGFLSGKKENTLAEKMTRDLSIRAANLSAPVETLSGGNQQKVMLGKWLASSPRVLILDEPTHGVDVGAKAEVHRLVRQIADSGVAVLMISSELPEIISMSDRIIVMQQGTISGELLCAEATQEKILNLALPQTTSSESGSPKHSSDAGKPPRHISIGSFFNKLIRQREYGVLALLILTVAIVTCINPAFLSIGNIRDMLIHCAPVVIVACGVTMVIVTREIDISVGSLMGLMAAIVGILASTQKLGLPVSVSVLVTLLAGAGIGFFNGLLVACGRVPSIIVTLGMLTALRGLTEILMGGKWITDLPQGLRFLGVGAWLGIPICIWGAAIVIVITIVLARHTPLGRRAYALGSNPHSAVLAGISPRRIRLFVFTYTGLLTAVATLISAPQLSVIESGIGVGFELLVVTCVVVGGTSISGGQGSVIGSVLGVLLMGIIATVLIFLRLGEMSTYWERAIQGAFILVAVLVDHLARHRSTMEGTA